MLVVARTSHALGQGINGEPTMMTMMMMMIDHGGTAVCHNAGLLLLSQARPGVDQQIAVLHELNTALTMASGHPSQNRVGGVIQTLVPLLSGANNEVGGALFENIYRGGGG